MVGNIYIVGQHLANGANNRVLTATSAYGINGEANFTYNGTQVDVAGTTDGVLNLDTTDSRGAFIRFGQGGSYHNMVGCADGLVTGLDKQDLAVRATDNFAIATNGDNERLRIDSSGRLLVNTTTTYTSNQIMIVKGASPTGGGNRPYDGQLAIESTETSGAINTGGVLAFIGHDGGTARGFGSIRNLKEDGTSGNYGTYMSFETRANGSAPAERLRIQSNGYVNIGTGTAEEKLTIRDTTQHCLIRLISNSASTAGIDFGDAEDTDIGRIRYYHSDGSNTNFMNFYVNAAERLRITSDGYSKHSNDGTYDTYSNAVQAHQFRQSANKPTLWCSNSNSSHTWEIIRAESARSNNSAYQFIVCTSGNLTDDEFRVRGDGQVYADGSFNSGGADYAEYFEWTDGNSSNEDRRGMTVVLDGNKVKLSTSSDSTDNIIGVVSGNASVIGDAASEKWTDKYLRDDYGAYQRDENGERKLNSSFDDTKTYVPREDRQEWDAIGMVGKLRIRKGQKTGTRWIKMRDISDTVEEWLVR